MAITRLKWERQPGWGIMKWRGWRVVMDNFLVHEGELLPRGYGVAWREYDRDCSVVMPIPLNLIAGSLRRLWHWLRWGWVKNSRIDEAYLRGRDAGSRFNVKATESREAWVRQAGYDAGRRDTMDALKALRDEVQELREDVGIG